MATMETNSATPEENTKSTASVLTEISAPTNFAEMTAADFGISLQSFIPPSLPSSPRREKSRLAQLKNRRRSNIGVRGSPETNSLIRFIAQQRMKTPPAPSPLQLLKNSPFLPPSGSSLRQKMGTFQSLLGEEEGEGSSSGGIRTRDDLSDGGNLEFGKENQPPSMALPPTKKRRLGPSQGCEEQIREDTPPPRFSLELEEEETPLKHKPVRFGEAEASVSPAVSEESDAQLWAQTEDQQEVVFDLGRIQGLVLTEPTVESGGQPPAPLHSPSICSLLEMKPTAVSLSSPAVKKRKKQVRFGESLPPELFDKNLPPSTPLKRGGTPARAQTPGGALRSLLKTPQRDAPSTQHTDISPSFFGASPKLSLPCSQKTDTSEDDRQMSGKIPFSLDDIEIEAAFEECILNVEPLNLNLAFNEEPHVDTDIETEEEESLSPMDQLPPEPLHEEELPPPTEAEAQTCGSSGRKTRRKVTEDTTEAPLRSRSRKRKLPEESEPAKRSSRAAAKTASGKMKQSSAGRRWTKKVDHSLYGAREYASRIPSLSPILERRSPRLSLDSQEPLPDHSPAPGLDPQPDLGCNGNSVSDDPATAAVAEAGDALALNASTTPQASLSSPPGAKHSGARRTRRLSGSKVRRRAVKGRKVSVNDEQADASVHERSEEDLALDSAKGGETEEAMLRQTTVEDSGEGEVSARILLETDANKESESTTSEEQAEAETSPDNQSGDDESEREDGEQIENTQPISDDQHEEEPVREPDLQPWQDDFNLEDVFKPVATRGQRSVRRSLRNKSGADPSCSDAGSAWLPHTSPETVKEARRRTRGRRLSAALLSLPSEETQTTEC